MPGETGLALGMVMGCCACPAEFELLKLDCRDVFFAADALTGTNLPVSDLRERLVAD
jgi:hypothetical protein